MKKLTPQEMQRRSVASRWANLTAEERSEMMRRVRKSRLAPDNGLSTKIKTMQSPITILVQNESNIIITERRLVKALIFRYNDEGDIFASKTNKCTQTDRRASSDAPYVVVVPTLEANSDLAIYGEASGGQYEAQVNDGRKQWATPPRNDKTLCYRVDVPDFKYTTVNRVIAAIPEEQRKWQAQWYVRLIEIDLSLL